MVENKARSIGIDPDTEKAWISKTAKLIHPLELNHARNAVKKWNYLTPTQMSISFLGLGNLII